MENLILSKKPYLLVADEASLIDLIWDTYEFEVEFSIKRPTYSYTEFVPRLDTLIENEALGEMSDEIASMDLYDDPLYYSQFLTEEDSDSFYEVAAEVFGGLMTDVVTLLTYHHVFYQDCRIYTNIPIKEVW